MACHLIFCMSCLLGGWLPSFLIHPSSSHPSEFGFPAKLFSYYPVQLLDSQLVYYTNHSDIFTQYTEGLLHTNLSLVVVYSNCTAWGTAWELFHVPVLWQVVLVPTRREGLGHQVADEKAKKQNAWGWHPALSLRTLLILFPSSLNSPA